MAIKAAHVKPGKTIALNHGVAKNGASTARVINGSRNMTKASLGVRIRPVGNRIGMYGIIRKMNGTRTIGKAINNQKTISRIRFRKSSNVVI